jgi:hypothetical protein
MPEYGHNGAAGELFVKGGLGESAGTYIKLCI